MKAGLYEKAQAHMIPFIDHYDDIGLIPETYDEAKMFGLIEYFAATYDGELVLYGGQTATERFYGFKRIRDVTTDLDFVCSEAGLEKAFESEKLFYHRSFDILFSVRDNVPVSLALAHIHDWPVDAGFFETAETVRLLRCPVRCCSREYSIMLKMRRMNELVNRGLSPFGKDALDIINMATAPYIRSDLSPVNFVLLSDLLLGNVTDDRSRLRELLAFIAGYRDHLTEWEFSHFKDALGCFSSAVSSNRGAGG